jgi:hypothetical protein
MKFEIRRGTKADASRIVRLLSEDGNSHAWSLQKWQNYYLDYPEGETISFVAESEEGIIGHYGLFPVLIGEKQVYMGAHAHVAKSVRGLAVISRLMRTLDNFCSENAVPFIVGFANQKFTIVKNKLFKWQTPFFASFVNTTQFDPSEFTQKPFRFQYSDDWLKWRFGNVTAPIISKYQKKDDEKPLFQLLYTESKVAAEANDIAEFECWTPLGYEIESDIKSFRQPFSIKIYDKHWSGPDLLNPANWYIQMGDSDTFVFKAK